MLDSVFVEKEFFMLIVFSLIIPGCICGYMMVKRAISRQTVVFLGVALVAISGGDLFVLQQVKTMAQVSASMFDDIFFCV
ncbi:MAG: hypothetical protein KGP14_07145 [Betaproteobacteria bacterium]|nr:hypothetical protein [Betaproteobacteria bacterium]